MHLLGILAELDLVIIGTRKCARIRNREGGTGRLSTNFLIPPMKGPPIVAVATAPLPPAIVTMGAEYPLRV